jgi:3-methyladenine DNA glycosylase AlkD
LRTWRGRGTLGRVSFSADPDAVLIMAGLRAAGSPERAASEQNYLKSTAQFTGTPVPAIRAIVTNWRRAHPDLAGDRVTELAAALWDGPAFECKLAGVILLADRRSLLGPVHAPLIEQFLRTSGTWALVDSLAADVMGSLVERFPELLATLDRWAADEDFWIRRAALLALLVPLRRGDLTHFDRFAGYADAMLAEPEFFIRKAIGWVLRETAKRHPDVVAAWLAPRARQISGVTIREAVKWLPADQRDRLLAVYRARKAG